MKSRVKTSVWKWVLCSRPCHSLLLYGLVLFPSWALVSALEWPPPMTVVRVRGGVHGDTMASTSSSKRHELDLRPSSWLDDSGLEGGWRKLRESKCWERRDTQSLERRQMENEELPSIWHHHFAKEGEFIQQICPYSQLCTGDARRS